MTWNWQRPDWPEFTWNKTRLEMAEKKFLLATGMFVGTFKHLGDQDRDQLTVEAMSTEALTTSEIEGEILERASVQSSIRKHLGLATDKRRAKPAEEGIAEILVDSFRRFRSPLSDQTLFAWHRLLVRGRRDIREAGQYRTGIEAMQVVSGAMYAPKVHFEAPPSAAVRREMKRFMAWFNRTGPNGKQPLPTLTRAGIAHLYFVSIHPFEDGNGRIGRTISETALAQGQGRPTLIALAATILAKRKSYYEMLAASNKKNEITDWLLWFAATTIEAQRRTIARVEFLIDKTRLLDSVRGQLNDRQEKALLRMFREGPEGFEGGLNAHKYAAITGASAATTTRDLSALVDKGALTRTGERRHARYHIAIPLRPVAPVVVGEW